MSGRDIALSLKEVRVCVFVNAHRKRGRRAAGSDKLLNYFELALRSGFLPYTKISTCDG